MEADAEAQPFLAEDNVGEKLDNFINVQRSKKISHLRSWMVSLATHGLVALLVLVAVNFFPWAGSVYFYVPSNAKSQPSLYSPLTPAIQYTIDKPPSDYWSNDLYFGVPSDESERAWNKMIHPHGIQILPDEADHFDDTDTVVLENGNHLFILGVYHNLHCLRRIRQTLNADYYYPNMTAEFKEHDLEHNAHCLESLRTSMLCHPDLTTNRFYWSDRPWHDLSVRPDVTRECMDWSMLEEFMKDRRYDPREIVKAHGPDFRIWDD